MVAETIVDMKSEGLFNDHDCTGLTTSSCPCTLVYAFLFVVFVGNGVVIHIPQFFEELQALDAKGSQKCPLPYLFHDHKA